MFRVLVLSFLLCLVTFNIGFTASLDNKVSDESAGGSLTEILPEPSQHSSTTPKITTVPPSNTTTTSTTPNPLPTNATTTTTTPNTTTTTTQTPNTTTTTPPTPPSPPTPTPTPPPSPTPTNATTTVSPPTTSAPHPAPSDRKFDAFSFLGGFAMGLGLVAIGFLSWKFYLSRQENYYHTL